ncbi:M15 family metallopeptidase [Vibrio cyclitrophicus]|uniref:M15 family metallopeptidase n=1 Tax=Vibrio cyclitrophicus TaxID=47951 RepID=UPI0020477DE2|nr:M15 family metallopeptidase [Vibrio cyclitrophicus]UPR24097.1 M15 family metallopeptidase [Vibrio cyclitrophicus]
MKRFFVGWLATVLSAASYAQVAPISQWQCDMMKKNNVLSSGAPVGCERLSKVDFDFINFKGETQQGNMIVLDVVAPSVGQIFSELKLRNFPLHSARLMREFRGDDNASMDANNSSAFNARPITGGGGWSKHAYGVAIDINPVQNPFLEFDSNGKITVKPSKSATSYVNRTRFRARDEIERRGMAEEVVELFAHHGFMIWGGDWNSPIDTQHFEVGSRKFVTQLLDKPLPEAKVLFERYIESYRQCLNKNHSDSKNKGEDAEKARAICAKKTVGTF